MKNIYKIKLILLALVVFSSCAVNDDDPVQNLVSKTELSLDNAFESNPSSWPFNSAFFIFVILFFK